MVKWIRSVTVEIEEWKTFIKICQREGESASQKIREWIEIYNRRHAPGNPIIPLDRFGARIVQNCELCGKASPNLWNVLYVSGKTLRSCKPCIDIRRPKGLVRKVLHLA